MITTSTTIRRNLLKNSLGILISRIITTLAVFFSVPFIIKNLGMGGYGTWESILAVATLCNILQGTISGTLLWLVSNAYGSKDIESIRQYVQMAVCISLALFVVITPLAWFGRYLLVDFFNIPLQFVPTAAWILPCIVGLMLLGSVNEIFGALIGGYQRAGVTTLTLATANTINYVIVITFLMLGFGFWSMLIGFATGFLVSSTGLYSVARRIAGPFSLLPLFPSRAVLIKIAPYVGFMLLGVISVALRDQTDKIILSSVASPIWTGYYGIATRLAGFVTMVCTFFYVPTIAAAGALYSKNDQESIYRLYNDIITLMSFLIGLIVVILTGLHDRIVFLWIGRPIPEVGEILYLLLFGNAIAVILAGTGSSICKGTGIIRIETIYIIIGLVLNILLKFIFVPAIGAIGAVVASAVSWSVSSVVFVVLLHKQTNIPWTGTVKAIKAIFAIGATASFARWLVSVFPVETTWQSVLISSVKLGGILTLVFTVTMYYLKIFPLKSLLHFISLAKAKLA